jgi:hypothetical protein
MTRERKLRLRAGGKHRQLRHLAAGLRLLAVNRPGQIRDTDHARRGLLGDVVHAEQLGDLDPGADLFAALADRRVARVLVVVDEPARQAPQAASRLDGTPAEQNTTTNLDDDRGHHLGVVPQHEVVVGTGLEGAALDDAGHELRSTFDAVVGHRTQQ